MFQLPENEQQLLLHIAREAVRSHLSQTPLQLPNVSSESLTARRGVFVSLHRGHRLRGCVGNISPTAPLYRTVAESAISAAVADPRFPPLTVAELNDVTFEISLLSPLELVQSADEIEIGTHGLLITKQHMRGLLLPQVASQYGWDREQFLFETCRKAGLHGNAWKEGATIHRFAAEILTEQKIHAA